MTKKNVLKVAGTVAAVAGTAACVTLVTRKKAKCKFDNQPVHIFECIYSHDNQPEAERMLLNTLEGLLHKYGKVESIRCTDAVKSEDKLFPEDYEFKFRIEIRSSLEDEELAEILYYVGERCVPESCSVEEVEM